MTGDTSLMLKRLDQKVQAGMREYLYKSGEKIQELAKLNAPVDEGDLEDSIVMEIVKGGGINRANTVVVGVDPLKLAASRAERGIVNSYRYDQYIHEAVYNLGEKSEEKDTWVRSFHPKASVGNKFLERSMLTLRPSILRGAKELAKKIIEREKSR